MDGKQTNGTGTKIRTNRSPGGIKKREKLSLGETEISQKPNRRMKKREQACTPKKNKKHRHGQKPKKRFWHQWVGTKKSRGENGGRANLPDRIPAFEEGRDRSTPWKMEVFPFTRLVSQKVCLIASLDKGNSQAPKVGPGAGKAGRGQTVQTSR